MLVPVTDVLMVPAYWKQKFGLISGQAFCFIYSAKSILIGQCKSLNIFLWLPSVCSPPGCLQLGFPSHAASHHILQSWVPSLKWPHASLCTSCFYPSHQCLPGTQASTFKCDFFSIFLPTNHCPNSSCDHYYILHRKANFNGQELLPMNLTLKVPTPYSVKCIIWVKGECCSTTYKDTLQCNVQDSKSEEYLSW